jgi:hypothetical protein
MLGHMALRAVFCEHIAFDCRHPPRRGDTPRILKHRELRRTSIVIAIIRRRNLK